MKKLYGLFIAVATIALIACGGAYSGGSIGLPPVTPPPQIHHPQVHQSPIEGVTEDTGTKTTLTRLTFGGPLASMATWLFQAHTTTTNSLNFTGSYSGFCSAFGYINQLQGYKYWLYGLGQYGGPACAQANPGEIPPGVPVIGGGTIGNLVVMGSGGAHDNSLNVTVYVNGTATALTCTLGTNNRCEDTTDTITVNDEDQLSALLETQPGDLPENIRVLFTKN